MCIINSTRRANYFAYRTSHLRGMIFWQWSKRLVERKVGVAFIGGVADFVALLVFRRC